MKQVCVTAHRACSTCLLAMTGDHSCTFGLDTNYQLLLGFNALLKSRRQDMSGCALVKSFRLTPFDTAVPR